MIRVFRPDEPPDILLKKGRQKKEEMCHLYDKSPNEYISGEQRFTFYSSIYSHTSVKDALSKAQHGKCCYCESKPQANSYGVIEHFRPKGSVKAEESKPDQTPGYYWLAYDWNNLLFCCERCNTSHKKTWFPLTQPEERACSHNDDICAESPLFIDPGQEDPKDHIRFRGAAIYPLTVRGKETIKRLGLQRSDLEEGCDSK